MTARADRGARPPCDRRRTAGWPPGRTLRGRPTDSASPPGWRRHSSKTLAEIALQRVILAQPEQLERGHEGVGDRREVRRREDRPWAGRRPRSPAARRRSAFRTSGNSSAAWRAEPRRKLRHPPIGIRERMSAMRSRNALGHESCFGRGRHPGVGRQRVEAVARRRLHGAGSRRCARTATSRRRWSSRARADAAGAGRRRATSTGRAASQAVGRGRPRAAPCLAAPRRELGVRTSGSRLRDASVSGHASSREARQAGHCTSSVCDDHASVAGKHQRKLELIVACRHYNDDRARPVPAVCGDRPSN